MRLSRRWLLAAAVVSFSCGNHAAKPVTFPAELPGGFVQTGSEGVAPADLPELVRSLRCDAAYRAQYKGGTPLTVTIYQMTASSSAFELTQKWRPAPGLLFFHAGLYFATLESPGAGQPMLNEVAKALEAHLR